MSLGCGVGQGGPTLCLLRIHKRSVDVSVDSGEGPSAPIPTAFRSMFLVPNPARKQCKKKKKSAWRKGRDEGGGWVCGRGEGEEGQGEKEVGCEYAGGGGSVQV